MPQVLNRRGLTAIPSGAVYVGRPSPWGNPYSHLEEGRTSVTDPAFHCGSRYQAVEAYKVWIQAPEQAPLLARARQELPGKDLVCNCSPLYCHAQILLALVNPPYRLEPAGV